MKLFLYIAAAVCAYLLTSVNPAIVVSQLVYHQDIRKCGSGNPGFTNFKRCFGNKWAWWVLIFDLAKGVIAVAIAAKLFENCGVASFQFGAVYTGIFALLGHMLPIWHNFKGGKGFLVYLSVIFVIDWRVGLIAVAVMVVLLLTTKYMSLSTVVALLTAPIALALLGAPASVVIICLCCVLVIAYRHKENFKRLRNGTESKFSFKSSKA